MPDQTHHVQKLSLVVDMSDEALARALRARLEDFTRDRIPPLLNRVFDSLSPADRHVRLRKIDLDLGVLPEEGFEAAAAAALERALLEALPGAIAAAAQAPSEGESDVTQAQSDLELLEYYLGSGSVPFWARAETFSLPALLQRLAAQEPAVLGALLRRKGAERRVLERLVMQAGEDELRGLIGLLAPGDAAVILAMLADLISLHRAQPLAPLTEPQLKRELWLLTFEYLLRDAGTQFNRRSFLEWLLQGLAMREDVDYGELLLLLQGALDRTQQRLPLGSSLPSVLRELLDDRRPTSLADDEAASLAADDDWLKLAQDGAPPDRWLAALRRRAHDRPALEALVRLLSSAAFARLVERLEPAHAAAILTYLTDLAALHREAPLLALSHGAFERLIRLLTLFHLLRDPGSQFNRREYLRQLLAGVADADRVSLPALLSVLRQGLELTARKHPLSASFLAVLSEVVIPAADASVETPAPAPDVTIGVAFQMALDAGDAAKLAALIAGFTRSDSEALTATLRQLAPSTLARLVAILDAATLRHVLGLLDSDLATVALPYLETLWRLHGTQPLLAMDEADFTRLAWTLALDYAARAPQTSARDLIRELVHGMAEYDDLDEADLVTTLSRGLDLMGDTRSAAALSAILEELRAEAAPADDLTLVAQVLNGGRPDGVGAALARLLDADPVALAALLRQGPQSIERLMQWLLPQELAAVLAPDSADAASRWADALAEAPDMNATRAWRHVLTTLLKGDAPPEFKPPAPGARLDRQALQLHWLDHGDLPWWAPPGLTFETLFEGLPQEKLAALDALFLTGSSEEQVPRLARAVAQIGDDPGRMLLARLALLAPDLVNAFSQDHDNGRSPPPSRGAAEPAREPPAKPLATDRTTLLNWLAGTMQSEPGAIARLTRLLAALLDSQDPVVSDVLRARFVDGDMRLYWIGILPDEVLARILYFVAPGNARFLIETAELAGAAWRQAVPAAASRLPWALLFDALAARPATARSARALAEDFLRNLTRANPACRAPFLMQARLLARDAGAVQLLAILQSAPLAPKPRAPKPKLTPPKPARGRKSFSLDELADVPPVSDPLYVRNAGLVLFNPFLPRFFEQLGVLAVGPDGRTRVAGFDAASRAVHLLQYLVDERCDRPEPDLPLNKLLCGLAPSTPIAASIDPTEQERDLCDSLIQAVLANWTIIKQTSPAGLRETFLQREGRVAKAESGWTLQVQRKTVDVLVDQIPWAIGVVYHRWMADPLHVTW